MAGDRAEPEDVLHIPIGQPFEEIKSLVIRETLRRAGGNKELAAKLLNISSRTIYRWLNDDSELTAGGHETSTAPQVSESV